MEGVGNSGNNKVLNKAQRMKILHENHREALKKINEEDGLMKVMKEFSEDYQYDTSVQCPRWISFYW
jgi:hypothetical protein